MGLATRYSNNLQQLNGKYKLYKNKILALYRLYKGNNKTSRSLYSVFSIEFSGKKKVYHSFFEINGVLCDSQYDFREKHSTEHSVTDRVNQVQSRFDQGMLSCGVFFV